MQEILGDTGGIIRFSGGAKGGSYYAPTVVINNFFFRMLYEISDKVNCLTVSYTNEPFFRSNG